jgi:radical SAM superfamily enzyme YgiQ (UPF0313 family)
MKRRILWPVMDLYKGDNQFIGIMIISSLLKKQGFHSEVVEADYNTIKTFLKQPMPTILAYSTPTIYAQTYLDLNRRIKKEYEVFSVFGGPHPTFFPEMIEEIGVDGICIGEGEYSLLELVSNLSSEKSILNIKNWWIKENDKIYKNPLRPLIKDLDELPLPDHKIFRKKIPHSIWQALVITSRGCPYSCTYCYNHVYKELYKGKGKILRRRSVDNVIAELKSIKQHKCYKFIRFLDDLFILSPDWIREFSKKYKKEIGLPFSCLVRANLVTPEIIKNLKEAGCWRILMGLESGDNFTRNKIFKRGMSEEEIINAARIIKDSGLKLVTANILGSPGSSFEADLKTLSLNMQIRPDYAGVSLLQPYPKTEIHEYAQKIGMLDSETMNLRESTVSRKSVLKYANKKEKDQIENLQKLFFIPIEFPWLLPVVKRLIKLPANPIYHFIFSRWINYCHYFRVIPARIGWKNILKRSKLYFKIAGLISRLTSFFKGGKTTQIR